MCLRIQMVSLEHQIEKDIWSWVENYIEANNKFYDYKFPVCPFAKSARLKGIVEVQAWSSGSVKTFIKNTVQSLLNNPEKEICIMVMPPRAKWTWGIPAMIEEINTKIIPQGSFVQYGTAIQTTSRYPGLFNKGEYFVVLVNNLGAVMDGHKALLKTDYYKPWSKEHYNDVVTRRQKLFEKYGKND